MIITSLYLVAAFFSGYMVFRMQQWAPNDRIILVELVLMMVMIKSSISLLHKFTGLSENYAHLLLIGACLLGWVLFPSVELSPSKDRDFDDAPDNVD